MASADGAGRSQLRTSEASGVEDTPAAPGEGASTVHGDRIWSGLFDRLCRSGSKLMRSFFSAKTRSPQRRAPSGKVWPCPLPFSSLHVRGANRSQRDAALKLGLNYVVLTLNFQFNGQRHFAEAVPAFGTRSIGVSGAW